MFFSDQDRNQKRLVGLSIQLLTHVALRAAKASKDRIAAVGLENQWPIWPACDQEARPALGTWGGQEVNLRGDNRWHQQGMLLWGGNHNDCLVDQLRNLRNLRKGLLVLHRVRLS